MASKRTPLGNQTNLRIQRNLQGRIRQVPRFTSVHAEHLYGPTMANLQNPVHLLQPTALQARTRQKYQGLPPGRVGVLYTENGVVVSMITWPDWRTWTR